MEPFSLVCDALASKEQKTFICGQIESLSCFHLVLWTETVCVDGIGDADHPMSLREFGCLGQICHPLTASHESQSGIAVHPLFFEEYLLGEVTKQRALHQFTMLAELFIFLAITRIVANTCEMPLVVHRDDNRLACMDDFVDV